MRPDAATFGALMFPTVLLARHCAWPRTAARNASRSRFCRCQPRTSVSRSCPVPLSSQGTTRMSRSLPGIIAAVGPLARLAWSV